MLSQSAFLLARHERGRICKPKLPLASARYFAEAAGTLLCCVNGKRERPTPTGLEADYWLSDGALAFLAFWAIHAHGFA